MVVFRHLMGTQHRKYLLTKLDKLLDERVLLGTGVGSKEMLRLAIRNYLNLVLKLNTLDLIVLQYIAPLPISSITYGSNSRQHN